MAGIPRVFFTIGVLCCAFSFVYSESENITSESNAVESRTFGHHFLKRISFAIIPAAFVVGVITTLLAALTVVSIKGLGIGVVLLILAIGQILARTLPNAHAATYSAPIPIVYSPHRDYSSSPVWVEKNW